MRGREAAKSIQHWAMNPARRQAVLRPEASWRLMLPVQPAAPIEGVLKAKWDWSGGEDDAENWLEWCEVDPSKHDSVLSNASSSPGDKKIRILGLHEWREAALTLAEAFKVDDVSMYFIDTPDRAHWTPEQKWQLHLRINEFITYAHLLKGMVVCAGDDYDCVGLWYVQLPHPLSWLF